MCESFRNKRTQGRIMRERMRERIALQEVSPILYQEDASQVASAESVGPIIVFRVPRIQRPITLGEILEFKKAS